jgi:hypothetical protein
VEGRAAVSNNAQTHGVNAALVVIHGEDAVEFEQLFQSLIADFSPQGTAETLLVHRIAPVIWQQRRLEKFEHDQLSHAAMGMIAPKDILLKMQVVAESTQYRVQLECMDELTDSDLKLAHALNAECERYALDGDDFYSPSLAKRTLRLASRELLERSHRHHTLLENQMFRARKELRAMQSWRSGRHPSIAVDNSKAAIK